MNIRIVSSMLLSVISISCWATNKLEFKNKTDVTLRVAAGSRATPPHKDSYFKAQDAMRVKPGQTGNLYVVENDQFPRIMYWQDGDSNAFWYEFDAPKGKGLEVQVVKEGKGTKLTTVPFTYNTITKDNIRYMSTIDVK